MPSIARQLLRHRAEIEREGRVVISDIPCTVRDGDVDLEQYEGYSSASAQHVSQFTVKMPIGTDVRPKDDLRFRDKAGRIIYPFIRLAKVQDIQQRATHLLVTAISAQFIVALPHLLFLKSMENQMFIKALENPMLIET